MNSNPNPGYSLYIGDEILPSYMESIISRYCMNIIRIPFNQPVQWNVIKLLNAAQMMLHEIPFVIFSTFILGGLDLLFIRFLGGGVQVEGVTGEPFSDS